VISAITPLSFWFSSSRRICLRLGFCAFVSNTADADPNSCFFHP
jgi:hypothetical protein